MDASQPQAIRARRVVTPGGVRDAVVRVRDGVILSVEDAPGVRRSEGIMDLGDLVLLPGLVDSHVHVNEPGRTAWEGFHTAGRAAIAGGVTTLVDMPLNAVPATTNVAALREKQRAAGRCPANVAFWGGVVPGNLRDLVPLAEEGVRGFKCFLVDSGVPEFPAVSEEDLRAAMPVVRRLGLPLLVHAELPEPIAGAERAVAGADPTRYATWLRSRPDAAEAAAVKRMIDLCRETGCRVHIVHVSSAATLDLLRAARAEGLPVTAETCPHYLFFEAGAIPDGATEFKCAPPIRDAAHRERLWEALLDGTLDLVASDHSPCPPEQKRRESGDFMAAWGGIASLELSLAAVWTAGRGRGIGLEHLARWMSERPAMLAGLGLRKGRIAEGADADLTAFDPDADWEVDPAALRQRHPMTPYTGCRLTGSVRRVWIGGREVTA